MSTRTKYAIYSAITLFAVLALYVGCCRRGPQNANEEKSGVKFGTSFTPGQPIITGVSANTQVTIPSHCSGSWIACDPTLPAGADAGGGENGCALPSKCVQGLMTGYELQGTVANMADGSQNYVGSIFTEGYRAPRNALANGLTEENVPAIGAIVSSSTSNFGTWSDSINVSQGPGLGFTWACPSNGTTAGVNGCAANWSVGGDRQTNAGYGTLAGNASITSVPYKGNSVVRDASNQGNDLVVIAAYEQTSANIGQPLNATMGTWFAQCNTNADCASYGNGQEQCISNYSSPGSPCAQPGDQCYCACTGATPAAANAQCPHGDDGTAATMTCQPVEGAGANLAFAGPPYSIGGETYGLCQSSANYTFTGNSFFDPFSYFGVNENTSALNAQIYGIGVNFAVGFSSPSVTLSCNTNADCPPPTLCDSIYGACALPAPGPTNLPCLCQSSYSGPPYSCTVGTPACASTTLGYNWVFGRNNLGVTQDIVASVSTDGGKTFSKSATLSMGSFVDDPTYGAAGADEPTIRVNAPGNGCIPGTAGCTTSPNTPATLIAVWDNVNASQGEPVGTATTGSAFYKWAAAASADQVPSGSPIPPFASGGEVANVPGIPSLPDPFGGPYLAEIPIAQDGSFTFKPVPAHCLNGISCDNIYSFPVEDDANCGPVAGKSATGSNAFNSWPSSGKDQQGACIASLTLGTANGPPGPYGVCTASGDSGTRCCTGTTCIGTASTTLTNAITLPKAKIDVASTTSLVAASPGTIQITSSTGVQTLTCTGSTATAFTGCTGGTGKAAAGTLVVTPDSVLGTCSLVANACLPSGGQAADGTHLSPIATDDDSRVAPCHGGNPAAQHFLNLSSCLQANGTYGSCLQLAGQPIQQAWQLSLAVRNKPYVSGQPVPPRVYLMGAVAQTPPALGGGAGPAGTLVNCGALGCQALDPPTYGSAAFYTNIPTNGIQNIISKVWFLAVSDNPFSGKASDWTTTLIGKDTDAQGNPAWPACLTNALNQDANTQSTNVPSFDNDGFGGNGEHWYRVALQVNPYWAGDVSSLTNGQPGNAPAEIVFAMERSTFASTCVLGDVGCDQAQYQAKATEYGGIRVIASQWPAATHGQSFDSWTSFLNSASTTPVQVLNPNYTAGIAANGGSQIIPLTDQGYRAHAGNLEVGGNQYAPNIAITEGTGGGIYAAVTFHQQVGINYTGAGALTSLPFVPGVGKDPAGAHPSCTLANGTGLDGGALTECNGYSWAGSYWTNPSASPLGQLNSSLGIGDSTGVPGNTNGVGLNFCAYDSTLKLSDCSNTYSVSTPGGSPTLLITWGAGAACCNYGNQLSDFTYVEKGFGFQVGVAPCTGASCPTGATTISAGTGVPFPERVTLGNTATGDYDFGLVGIGNGKWIQPWADNRNWNQPNITAANAQPGFPPAPGSSVPCVHDSDCPSNVCLEATCMNMPGIYSQIYSATFSSSAP